VPYKSTFTYLLECQCGSNIYYAVFKKIIGPLLLSQLWHI